MEVCPVCGFGENLEIMDRGHIKCNDCMSLFEDEALVEDEDTANNIYEDYIHRLANNMVEE